MNAFVSVWSGGEQLGVRTMTWTAESLTRVGLQMCWDLEQMRTVICKPGVSLRVCFSDRLPGDIEVVGTWVPRGVRVQSGRQAPWGVWVKRLGNNALLWAGSGGPVIVFSRRMAVDGEENRGGVKGVQPRRRKKQPGLLQMKKRPMKMSSVSVTVRLNSI